MSVEYQSIRVRKDIYIKLKYLQGQMGARSLSDVIQSLIQGFPAESISAIIREVLERYFQKKFIARINVGREDLRSALDRKVEEPEVLESGDAYIIIIPRDFSILDIRGNPEEIGGVYIGDADKVIIIVDRSVVEGRSYLFKRKDGKAWAITFQDLKHRFYMVGRLL